MWIVPDLFVCDIIPDLFVQYNVDVLIVVVSACSCTQCMMSTSYSYVVLV